MPDSMPTKFRIGRRDPKTNRLVFAFWIERTEEGGIRITRIAHKLSDSERNMLFAHFGSELEGNEGGWEQDKMVTRISKAKPGTARHFMRAVKSLPGPFHSMAENYESFLR